MHAGSRLAGHSSANPRDPRLCAVGLWHRNRLDGFGRSNHAVRVKRERVYQDRRPCRPSEGHCRSDDSLYDLPAAEMAISRTGALLSPFRRLPGILRRRSLHRWKWRVSRRRPERCYSRSSASITPRSHTGISPCWASIPCIKDRAGAAVFSNTALQSWTRRKAWHSTRPPVSGRHVCMSGWDGRSWVRFRSAVRRPFSRWCAVSLDGPYARAGRGRSFVLPMNQDPNRSQGRRVRPLQDALVMLQSQYIKKVDELFSAMQEANECFLGYPFARGSTMNPYGAS